ncbi:MAG: NFACT family protein [Clostridia bacterium]|nr:NFACT family protein [Clostridia bacterium]
MALDGIVLNKLSKELNKSLSGLKVSKIYNAGDNTYFVFKDNVLLLSSNATFPRCYLTLSEHVPDDKQTNFTMNLRKHLSSAIFRSCEQVGLDRILDFTFDALNEFKDKVELHLILEIMGKYSNLILVSEDGTIIDAHTHVSSLLSSKREVLPKIKYERIKEENKRDILELEECSILEFDKKIEKIFNSIKETDADIDAETFLSKHFFGISKLVAHDFVSSLKVSKNIPIIKIDKDLIKDFYTYISEIINKEKEDHSLKELLKEAGESDFGGAFIPDKRVEYAIYQDKNGIVDFHVINIDEYDKANLDKENFASISMMLESYFKKKAKANDIKASSTDLKLLLSNAMTKALKKKEIHTKSINDSKEAEHFKELGDLIFGNLYQIKKGQSEVTLVNYYSENQDEITIKLDENLTPQENANRFFKKYNKMKSTYKNAVEQLAEVDKEIVYLETVISYLDNATSKDDLENIREELRESGYLKKKFLMKKLLKQNKKKDNPYLKFTSSDGFEILVGKNNIQNDEITFKVGKDSDV